MNDSVDTIANKVRSVALAVEDETLRNAILWVVDLYVKDEAAETSFGELKQAA